MADLLDLLCTGNWLLKLRQSRGERARRFQRLRSFFIHWHGSRSFFRLPFFRLNHQVVCRSTAVDCLGATCGAATGRSRTTGDSRSGNNSTTGFARLRFAFAFWFLNTRLDCRRTDSATFFALCRAAVRIQVRARIERFAC